LSEKGWIRAAKGHDIDPSQLNYRAGDEFLTAVHGKTNQTIILFDSNGRSYSLSALGLPSARSLGEPLTGKLSPESGAEFIGMILPEQVISLVLCSSAGYGFITNTDQMSTKNRAGKACLNPGDGVPLTPLTLDERHSHLLMATSEGRMLMIPLEQLPDLAKGKGLKLINLNAKQNEAIIALVAVHTKSKIEVNSGRRKLNLSWSDLQHYAGDRAKTGQKLPKGYPRIDTMHDNKD